MTEFKPISLIPGYEEFTEHTIDINGVLRKGDRILKWGSHKDGYLRCMICNDSKHRKNVLQHRAIALLFISNPDNKPFVDHMNGIRDDNRVDNLRWCTKGENQCNSKAYCTNKLGHKNICKYCAKGKYWYWRIQVDLNGKPFTKLFRCEQDDVEPPAEVLACRDQMLLKYHGEFARYGTPAGLPE